MYSGTIRVEASRGSRADRRQRGDLLLAAVFPRRVCEGKEEKVRARFSSSEDDMKHARVGGGKIKYSGKLPRAGIVQDATRGRPGWRTGCQKSSKFHGTPAFPSAPNIQSHLWCTTTTVHRSAEPPWPAVSMRLVVCLRNLRPRTHILIGFWFQVCDGNSATVHTYLCGCRVVSCAPAGDYSLILILLAPAAVFPIPKITGCRSLGNPAAGWMLSCFAGPQQAPGARLVRKSAMT